jgi:hypothetical protein
MQCWIAGLPANVLFWDRRHSLHKHFTPHIITHTHSITHNPPPPIHTHTNWKPDSFCHIYVTPTFPPPPLSLSFNTTLPRFFHSMTSLCWTHLCTGLIKYSDRMLRMAELSSTLQVVIQSFAVLDESSHCISQNNLPQVAPTTTVAAVLTIRTTFFNL